VKTFVDCHGWLKRKWVIVFRRKKCYWVLFACIIDMTLVNAWIMYRLVQEYGWDSSVSIGLQAGSPVIAV
jgi:hypothetical protein